MISVTLQGRRLITQPLQKKPFLNLVYYIFLLEQSCFTILCQFLLYSKVNQLYVYIYPLFFGFPSHLGHHTALSRVPCAIQSVLISYLFYTQQHIHVNPNLQKKLFLIQDISSEFSHFWLIGHSLYSTLFPYTTLFRSVQHRELYSVLHNDLYGNGVQKRVDICIYMTDSLCCTAENNTTL